MNRKVPMLGAIVALFLSCSHNSIVGFSLPEQGDAPFKRFANSTNIIFGCNLIFDSKYGVLCRQWHKPLSPIVGMLLSLSAGFIVAYLIFSLENYV